ncbi:MAG: DUF2251 domain-containing protein [Mucilaginibacter sp.]|uniref:DUF2251 domain-containing protein n=1 Tax=Mucilaginibacter sp. TaxID=1882438 RepID=UPI0031AEC631
MTLSVDETFIVGEDTYYSSNSYGFKHGVIFEDDLNTGYFYAVETQPQVKILDAVHIYNVGDVVDKVKPCNIKIVWTEDEQFASLLINNYCHAIFDFKNKAGYCRTAFPESNGKWDRKELTDDLIIELLTEKA